MTHEQAAFVAAQNRHHRYMGFGKKQRYIEVFQCSGEDMSNVLTGPQPSSLSMAAHALSGGGNPDNSGINSGSGILGGANHNAIAAAALKAPNPSAGLLSQGMLNSLQSQPSSIISNGLVGNQLAAFQNSQPPPNVPTSSASPLNIDQYNAMQNNPLFLNQQNVSLLGHNASAINNQLGINNYLLPPPQPHNAVAALAAAQAAQNSILKSDQSNPASLSLPNPQSNGGMSGLLQGVRSPLNNLNAGAPGDPASAAMLNALMANGIPVSGTQSLFPLGVPGLSAAGLQNGAQSFLAPGSGSFQTASGFQLPQAGIGGLGGLLLPPTPTSNSALMRLPSPLNSNHATNGVDFAFGGQQNQASLLQSQLAAQRMLLSQSIPNATAGLLPTVTLAQAVSSIGMPSISTASHLVAGSASSNTGKRSFDNAFSAPAGVAAAVAHAAQAAKRANYSYANPTSQPTISAGPTTYSHVQQPSTNDP